MATENPIAKSKRKVIKLPPMPKGQRIAETQALFEKFQHKMSEEDRERAKRTLAYWEKQPG